LDTSELIYKIRSKINENQRIYSSEKKKPQSKIQATSEVKSKLLDPFNLLGNKRSRGEMEDDTNESHFTYKYQEGYINAVKRNVPFDFFL